LSLTSTSSWPPKQGKAFVLVNETAGSVGKVAREKLLAILQEAGVEAAEVHEDMTDLRACRRRAARADMVIVLGGDGTASAAAEAFENGPPLIVLPGGTLNVLPHALYGERAWPEALRAALAGGHIVRLVGGKANGKRFFVAALFGAPTLLARARESVRQGKLFTAFGRLRHALKRMFVHHIEMRPAGGQFSRVEACGVLCPAYVGEIEDNALEWVGLDVPRIADLARVSLRALIGGWRQDSTINLTRAKNGIVRSSGVIPASLDGEPTAFVSRVKIEIVRNGPRVVALD
jgi:diacylglycerol kinase family enzyme